VPQYYLDTCFSGETHHDLQGQLFASDDEAVNYARRLARARAADLVWNQGPISGEEITVRQNKQVLERIFLTELVRATLDLPAREDAPRFKFRSGSPCPPPKRSGEWRQVQV
jgi:hypothetical protein